MLTRVYWEIIFFLNLYPMFETLKSNTSKYYLYFVNPF